MFYIIFKNESLFYSFLKMNDLKKSSLKLKKVLFIFKLKNNIISFLKLIILNLKMNFLKVKKEIKFKNE